MRTVQLLGPTASKRRKRLRPAACRLPHCWSLYSPQILSGWSLYEQKRVNDENRVDRRAEHASLVAWWVERGDDTSLTHIQNRSRMPIRDIRLNYSGIGIWFDTPANFDTLGRPITDADIPRTAIETIPPCSIATFSDREMLQSTPPVSEGVTVDPLSLTSITFTDPHSRWLIGSGGLPQLLPPEDGPPLTEDDFELINNIMEKRETSDCGPG